jgi:hypothetical protein
MQVLQNILAVFSQISLNLKSLTQKIYHMEKYDVQDIVLMKIKDARQKQCFGSSSGPGPDPDQVGKKLQINLTFNRRCGSVAWTSWIRIHNYLYGSGSFHHKEKYYKKP